MSQFNIKNLSTQNVQINGRNGRINERERIFDESRIIDERKVISAIDIEIVSIKSLQTAINIKTSDEPVIKLRLYGRTDNTDKITFINAKTYKNELAIALDECATGNLILEVNLPKKNFKKLEIYNEKESFVAEGILADIVVIEKVSNDIG